MIINFCFLILVDDTIVVYLISQIVIDSTVLRIVVSPKCAYDCTDVLIDVNL